MHFGRRTNLWLMGWYGLIEVWVITESTVPLFVENPYLISYFAGERFYLTRCLPSISLVVLNRYTLCNSG